MEVQSCFEVFVKFLKPGNVSELYEILLKKNSNKDSDSNQQVLNYENRIMFGETKKKRKRKDKTKTKRKET